ncbi:hypothetical protein ACNKHM_04695 [Shigella sonnei]
MPSCVADVPRSLRDKQSHTMRLVTITVGSIIPIASMVLATATGYSDTTLPPRALD